MVKPLMDVRKRFFSKPSGAYKVNPMPHRQIALVLFWLLFCISCVLLLIELAPSQPGWPYWDKVQHLALFSLLSFLAKHAYPTHLWRSSLGLISYGLLIEWLQGILTITRVPSLQDWFADIIGVVIGLMLAYALGQTRKPNH